MSNKELAGYFSKLGNLMELHEENPFKARSYQFAYRSIRNHENEISNCTPEEINNIPGIGKAIADKIQEIIETGELKALNVLLEKTPPGIVEMMGIKGVGPKKIRAIWKELEIEDTGSLLYAVHENRLLELKGFGTKVQQSIKEQLEYHLESKGKFHYAKVHAAAEELLDKVKTAYPEERISLCGKVYKKSIELESIDLLASINLEPEDLLESIEDEDLYFLDGRLVYKQFDLNLYYSKKEDFYFDLFEITAGETLASSLSISKKHYKSQEELFEKSKVNVLIPEMWEIENLEIFSRKGNAVENAVEYIQQKDIKGVIHSHTKYSDGASSVLDMAKATAEKGYEYIVITDHSKAAFYANGLSEERLFQQIDEIDAANGKTDATIFSGIEADILNNGDLDFDDDTLASLDVVIASVHSNLKMDIHKATDRIIRAIENPFTRILGHPTGRLILSRKGYPIDHEKIIDACAENEVCIEINANPHRLDIDWRWIDMCMQKDVMLSINPDAHSIAGIDDIFWGVCAARKGGLTKDYCLNTKSTQEFEDWIRSKT